MRVETDRVDSRQIHLDRVNLNRPIIFLSLQVGIYATSTKFVDSLAKLKNTCNMHESSNTFQLTTPH